MNAGNSLYNTNLHDSNFKLHTSIFNGVNSKHRINGIEYVSGDTGSDSLTGLRLGASNNLSGTGYLEGDIGEFVMFNKLLTTQELNNLEKYFINKWI